MDGEEFDLDYLADMFIDWNNEDFLSPHFDLTNNPHAGFQDEDLMDFFNFEIDLPTQTIEETLTELAVVPTSAVVGSLVDTQTKVQTTEPMSYQESSISSGRETTAAPTFVPNPLSMSQQNPVQATPGIERGNSSEFVTPQRPALFPPHNLSHAAWNSRPDQNQFSAPDVYGAQYAPNYTRSSPQPSFTTMQNQQVGHASELQQIFDLQSQNSVRPVYPMNPRSEPYSNLQPSFVTMPPNPYQQCYRPVLPEPAAPSASSLANYGQQPSLLATTSNSFGSGSSMPPTYPPLYENQDQHRHPQDMMPNDHGQQSGASVQQWPQGVPNQTSLQAMSSRILGLSSTRRTEGTSSRVPNPREAEIAPVFSSSRVQQVATSANEVPTHDKGKVPRSLSTRTQPSEAIRRILDMNPRRIVTRNPTTSQQNQISGSLQTGTTNYDDDDLGKQLLSLREQRYELSRRCRPSRKRDAEESSSQPRKWQRVSSETEKAGRNPISQQAQRIHDSAVNQNAIPANPPAAPRQFVNSVYDTEYERNGVPIDPHLRLFRPPPAPEN